MNTLEQQQKGGFKRGLQLKQSALEAKLKYNQNPNLCKFCNSPILAKLEDQTLQPTLKKKFCNHSCAAKLNNSKFPKKPPKKSRSTKQSYYELFSELSKQQVFQKFKNWQSARAAIRQNAVYVYKNSSKLKECLVCKYNHPKVIQVAHIKAVKNFSPTALMKDINNINNLICLCPTHHTEYDKHVIVLNLVEVGGVEPNTVSGI